MEPWEKNRKKSKNRGKKIDLTRRKKIDLESEPKKSFWENSFFLWYLERWQKNQRKPKKSFWEHPFFESRLYQNGCGVITIIFIIVLSLLCATHCDMFEGPL